MPYQPQHRNNLRETTTYSRYSHPRRLHDDGSYEIHLIKSSDPAYIPDQPEVWPIHYRAVVDVLLEHPDVHRQCVEAVEKVAAQLEGRENRDIPPGSRSFSK